MTQQTTSDMAANGGPDSPKRCRVSCPSLELLGPITGMWRTRAINAAAQLRIADALADGPRAVAELAEVTGTHAPSLYRLLRALSRLGIFSELGDERFANSELSHFLRPGVPGSMYALVRGFADWGWRSWGELAHSVRTGEPAFDLAHGMPMWQYFTQEDPEAGWLYNESMEEFSASVNTPIADAVDLAGIRSVVDVGGGHGGLLTTILARNPSVARAVLFEQPRVIKELRYMLDGKATGDGRLQLAEGDFFAAVPAGCDAYLMKIILHDWDDSQAINILANCRRCMNPGGRVLAAEIVLDAHCSEPFPNFLDLEMLVMHSGRERSTNEFRDLYAAAGLRLTRIIPTSSPFSIVEGVAAE
jgi:SAM-dependent methyltransferase